MRWRLLILAVALLAGGCVAEPPAEPVTFRSWQKNLEEYVWDQANGDANVLRDLSWDDVHRGFAVFSDPLPDRSTDAIGLLLAHRKLEGEPCFVFLFVLLRERVPVEMRAVALEVRTGRFQWSVGTDDPVALGQYQTCHGAGGFPAASDAFDVQIEADQIEIVDQPSGARWSVSMTPASQPVKEPLSYGTANSRSLMLRNRTCSW